MLAGNCRNRRGTGRWGAGSLNERQWRERCGGHTAAILDVVDGAPDDGAPADGAPDDGAPDDGAPRRRSASTTERFTMERLAMERLTAERLTMERLATETLATESVGAAACVAMLASPLSTIKRVLSTRFPHWGNEPRPTSPDPIHAALTTLVRHLGPV